MKEAPCAHARRFTAVTVEWPLCSYLGLGGGAGRLPERRLRDVPQMQEAGD